MLECDPLCWVTPAEVDEGSNTQRITRGAEHARADQTCTYFHLHVNFNNNIFQKSGKSGNNYDKVNIMKKNYIKD